MAGKTGKESVIYYVIALVR